MRRRTTLALSLLALAGAAAVTLAATATATTAAPATRAPSGEVAQSLKQLRGVNFVGHCGFSHRNSDDPIVFPRQFGLSHNHTFIGNTSTNAFSTPASLLQAGTTCRRPGETAAYWMPTLLVNGEPVAPLGATVYYRRRTLDPVQPFPPGLKVIAGDSKATGPQDRRVTFWNCGAAVGVPPSSEVPTCPAGRRSGLRLHVTFPSCWDGRNLDSADHKSHLAYPQRGRCPGTHPVAVPAITVIFRYPASGGAGTELASGGVYSGHADFLNTWNQETLARLVNGCLNALRHCGAGA
jgi:hypothetical protein